MVDSASKNKLYVIMSIMILFFVISSINYVYGFTPTYGSMSGNFIIPSSSYSENSISNTGSYLVIKSLTAKDGFDGYRRRVDSVVIVIQASFGPNKTVTPQNLEVYMSGYGLGMFDACKLISAQSSLYECVFMESNSSAPVTSVTQNYEVRLVSNYGIGASVIKSVMVDSAAPSINSFTLSSTRTSGANITSSFSIRDYASGKSGTGVGLKSVVITVDGNQQFTYPSTSTTDSITRFSSLTKSLVLITLGTDEKVYNVCIIAVDAFDFQSQICQQVQVDKTAPDIQISSFELLDENGNPPRWLSNQEYPLTATLFFQGSDIDVSSIRGNFSSVSLEKNYASVKPSCTKMNQDSWRCIFSLSARINQTKSFPLIFTVLDTLKNKAESKIQYSLNYDGLGPIATQLYSEYFYEGDYYIGKSLSQLMVRFNEPGIGMNSSTAYLDLSAIGAGTVKAIECIPQWECYWENISASSATIASLPDLKKNISRQEGSKIISFKAKPVNVSISSQTKDDLGNFAQSQKQGLVVDIFAPEVITSTISSIPSSTEFSNFTILGDSISIKLNVRDALPVYMSIDASSFFNATDSLEFDCVNNGDGTHMCSAIIGPISRQGYYKAPITVTVSDILNNSFTISKEIEVILIDDKPPTYWKGEVLSCAPNPLDRKLVNTLSSNIYCSILLHSAADVSIYDISEGPCFPLNTTGAKGKTASSLSSFKWLGLPQHKSNIYLNLVTGTFDPRIDSLNYECYVQVRSKVGNTAITRNYEPVTMQFHIGLYDNPMGEVDDSVYNEIEGVYNTYVGGAWDIVGYLNSFITLSEKMCRIAGTIETMFRAWDSLQTLLSFKTSMLSLIPATKPASLVLGAATVAQTTPESSLHASYKKMHKDFIGPYCDFISCSLWYGNNSAGNLQKSVITYTNFISSGFGFTKFLTGDKAAFGGTNFSQGLAYSNLTSTRYYDDKKQAEVNRQLDMLRHAVDTKKKSSATNRVYGQPAPSDPEVPSGPSSEDSDDDDASSEDSDDDAGEDENPDDSGNGDETTGSGTTEGKESGVDSSDSYIDSNNVLLRGPPPTVGPIIIKTGSTPGATPAATPHDAPPSGETPFEVKIGRTKPEYWYVGDVVSDLPLTGKAVAPLRVTPPGDSPIGSTPAAPTPATPTPAAPTPAAPTPAAPLPGGDGTVSAGPDGVLPSNEGNPYTPDADPTNRNSVRPDDVASNRDESDGSTSSEKDSGMGTLVSNLNIKNSWVLSTLTLCVPGMVYNLEKWRQIQCDYALCLSTSAQSSLPVSLCKDNKAYNECVFFWGPIFEIIPLSSFMTMLQKMVVNIIANPILLVDASFDYICHSERGYQTIECKGGGLTCFTATAAVRLCLFYDTADLFMKVFTDLKSFMDPEFMKFEMGANTGSCKKLKEEYEYLQTGKRATTT